MSVVMKIHIKYLHNLLFRIGTLNFALIIRGVALSVLCIL